MPPSDVRLPTVPEPEGWRIVGDEVTTPFDARVVAVRAHTVTLVDDSLRERVRERTGADATWRFFFASRLRLDPAPPPSRTVTRLVANRATDGFADVLRERGFESVRAGESRRFSVRGEDADLTRYDARASVGEFALAAEGYAAVREGEDGRDYLVAGGAYPREVESGPDAEAVSALLDPDRFRRELFEMVRATR